MTKGVISNFINMSFERQLDRLKVPLGLFPLPFLFPFVIYLLLTEFVSLTLNPRLGNPAHILNYHGEEQLGGGIWLSVAEHQGRLVLTTDEKKVFFFPLQPTKSDLEQVSRTLKARIFEDTLTAGLANGALLGQTRVILAVDQQLSYQHILPLIFVLAEANITNISFETRNAQPRPE